MGEPGGIGAELALAAWRALRADEGVQFLAIDDPERLRRAADGTVEIIETDTAEAAMRVFRDGFPVIPERLPQVEVPGKPNPSCAHAALRSIERAAALAQSGAVGGMVTSPVDKQALHAGAGFAHPGHTEYLAALAGGADTVMMLVADGLRTIPLTIHLPLRSVPEQITTDRILRSAHVASRALADDFGLPNPRIAVAGLNPHAGEGGLFGTEERDIIRPAVERLQAEGISVEGPFPADTLFRPPFGARFEAILCMYHDQALIPVKTRGFPSAVNVTLGLPFIRTSPGHGVAYDMVGRNAADARPLIAAIRLAAALSRRRAAWT